MTSETEPTNAPEEKVLTAEELDALFPPVEIPTSYRPVQGTNLHPDAERYYRTGQVSPIIVEEKTFLQRLLDRFKH